MEFPVATHGSRHGWSEPTTPTDSLPTSPSDHKRETDSPYSGPEPSGIASFGFQLEPSGLHARSMLSHQVAPVAEQSLGSRSLQSTDEMFVPSIEDQTQSRMEASGQWWTEAYASWDCTHGSVLDNEAKMIHSQLDEIASKETWLQVERVALQKRLTDIMEAYPSAGSDIKAEEFVEPQVELECFFAGEEETPKSNSGYKLRRCKPECLARRSKSEDFDTVGYEAVTVNQSSSCPTPVLTLGQPAQAFEPPQTEQQQPLTARTADGTQHVEQQQPLTTRDSMAARKKNSHKRSSSTSMSIRPFHQQSNAELNTPEGSPVCSPPGRLFSLQPPPPPPRKASPKLNTGSPQFRQSCK